MEMKTVLFYLLNGKRCWKICIKTQDHCPLMRPQSSLHTRQYLTPAKLHIVYPAVSPQCFCCYSDMGYFIHIFWSCKRQVCVATSSHETVYSGSTSQADDANVSIFLKIYTRCSHPVSEIELYTLQLSIG